MYKINKQNFLILFILLLIFPIVSLILSIKNFQLGESKLIVYIFCVFFGLTLVLGNDKLDSFQYAQYLKDFETNSNYTLDSFYDNFLTSEKSLDIAQFSISFIVSKITFSHSLLFGIFALIFGFFYIKSISNLYALYSLNKNYLSLVLLLIFVFNLNPIFNINGFRFWTATWIFFYGVYEYFSKKDQKYFVFIFLSILFHFSFIIPVLIFFIYFSFGNHYKLYFYLLISSFFFSELVVNILPDYSYLFGEGIAMKVSRYSNEDYIEKSGELTQNAIEEFKWYLFLPGKLMYYYLLFIFFFILREFKTEIKFIKVDFLSFTLLFISFSNFVSFVPTMARFKTLSLLFIISYLINVLSILNFKFRFKIFLLGIIPFILGFIVSIRLGLDLISPWLMFFLPMSIWDNNTSLYQLLFN
jgi:hypothetical protein